MITRNIRMHANTLKLFSIILAVILLAATGCSKPEPETEPEPEESVAEEDFSIYGDESLGIDAVVGEGLRDYRSILIAGTDNGHRADIQMILCINEETGAARVFTVTRDTYMQIAHGETVTIDDREFEFCKCNRAYEIGDKYDLMKELNRHLDLNIKEFIGVDWACAANLVDALGGIECNIESQSMLDAINETIAGFPEADAELISGTGTQTLSGWQAVQYLRVRKYKGGSPSAREERSRAFVESLLVKAKTLSMDEISDIYDEIADELDTNMSRNTLTDTLALLSGTEIEDIGGWPYESESLWEPDGYFVYVVPDSLYSNVIELHAKLFDEEQYLPSVTVQELSDKIKQLASDYLKQDK